jgi:hypothetical protein
MRDDLTLRLRDEGGGVRDEGWPSIPVMGKT